MKKRALLIGAPGGLYSQFLNGVEGDLHNIHEHLISPQGGAWNSNEIITLTNATLAQINAVFNDLNADYTQILFSGHGSTDEYGRRLLHLTDGDSFADEDFLQLKSSRLLMLVDACRVYSPVGIGFVPLSEDTYSYFDGNYEQLEYARKVYNNWIKQTPSGRVIIHATDDDNTALDIGTGGLFTTALLHYATKLKPNGKKCTGSSIITIGDKAAAAILQEGYSQRPTVVYKEGNIELPFAMGVPEIKHVQKSLPVKKSNAGAIFLTALIIGAIAGASRK